MIRGVSVENVMNRTSTMSMLFILTVVVVLRIHVSAIINTASVKTVGDVGIRIRLALIHRLFNPCINTVNLLLLLVLLVLLGISLQRVDSCSVAVTQRHWSLHHALLPLPLQQFGLLTIVGHRGLPLQVLVAQMQPFVVQPFLAVLVLILRLPVKRVRGHKLVADVLRHSELDLMVRARVLTVVHVARILPDGVTMRVLLLSGILRLLSRCIP